MILGRTFGLTLICIVLFIPFYQPTPSSPITDPAYPQYPSTTPDFTLAISPSFLELAAGTLGSSTITLSSQYGFSGSITLSASSYFDVSLDKTNITLTAGATATATLTILTLTGTPPGNYTTSITASNGCNLSHSARIAMKVTGPDFTFTAEKTQLTAAPGGSDNSKIDLASIDGFSGSIALSSFSFDFTLTLVPNSVTLTPNGAASSTLTVTVPTSTTPGSYTLEVSATSNTLYYTVDIQVTVTGPSFSLSASPTSLTVLAGGQSNSSIITITTSGGFTGVVSLTNSSSPTGLTTSISPKTLTVYGTTTSTLTVTAPSGTTPGSDYLIILTAAASSHTETIILSVTVNGPDFDISTNPSTITLTAGRSSCAPTMTITSLYSFHGTVTLTNTTFPTGLTPSLSITSLTAPGISILTVSAPLGTTPGAYFVEVDGSSGPLAHSASVAVIVTGPDFNLAANPTALTIGTRSTGTSTITLTSTNGFTGQASLSTIPSLNLNASIQPTITVSGTTTLTVNSTIVGSYTLEVDASSGPLFHRILLSVTVRAPDFSLPPNPAPLTIQAGSSATANITVTPAYGFTGAVNLTVTVSPPGPTAHLSTETILGGSGVSTLTVIVDPTVPAATYTIIILASSGSLSHSTEYHVTVAPASSSSPSGFNILGLGSTASYALVGGLVVALGLAALLVVRTRKRTV